ncbi:MAG: hypothetical protein LUC91_04285 [Prevotella sp.]|nr:hypothetical protein [Prevotella sp.]
MSIFSLKDTRSRIVVKNIFFSAVLKGVGLLCSFLIVPVTIDYLNSEVYGIWLTMSSILYWFSYFDVGLGNGMRNYLSGAFSLGDYASARAYISTTFTALAVVAAVIGIIVVAAVMLLDLNAVFNTSSVAGGDLRTAMLLAVVMTLLLFVVKNIGVVYIAMQRYAVNSLIVVSGNVIALAVIYALTLFTEGNVVYVVAAFTITPVLVFFISAVPLFARHPEFRPSLRFFDKSIARRVIGKGLGFFLIQITSCLVIFGGANIFIAQYCGPANVTVYNIAYKYFHLIAMVYIIVLSPMWNAYTDAYVKGNTDWIRRTFNRTLAIWGVTVAAGAVMLAVCGYFYRFWVGNAVAIPFVVSLATLFYVCFYNLNTCVTMLLNGLNKIRVQIYTSVVFTAVFLASMFAGNHRFGVAGIVAVMAACYAAMSLIHCYQCRLIINKKAQGIWNK